MLHATIKHPKQDTPFRIKAFLCTSFAFNLTYAIFLLTVSILYRSQWFFAMSVYYTLFSIARIFIFVQLNPKRQPRTKIVTMLICGCFLLLINLAVSTIMFILLYGNHYVKHHEITVITMATYTFSTLTVAIIGSIKHIKENNHLFTCVKLFSLTSASVSLVTLTNVMLTTFGEANIQLRNIVLPALCGVVACFIVACAGYMIRKAHFDLKV